MEGLSLTGVTWPLLRSAIEDGFNDAKLWAEDLGMLALIVRANPAYGDPSSAVWTKVVWGNRTVDAPIPVVDDEDIPTEDAADRRRGPVNDVPEAAARDELEDDTLELLDQLRDAEELQRNDHQDEEPLDSPYLRIYEASGAFSRVHKSSAAKVLTLDFGSKLALERVMRYRQQQLMSTAEPTPPAGAVTIRKGQAGVFVFTDDEREFWTLGVIASLTMNGRDVSYFWLVRDQWNVDAECRIVFVKEAAAAGRDRRLRYPLQSELLPTTYSLKNTFVCVLDGVIGVDCAPKVPQQRRKGRKRQAPAAPAPRRKESRIQLTTAVKAEIEQLFRGFKRPPTANDLTWDPTWTTLRPSVDDSSGEQ